MSPLPEETPSIAAPTLGLRVQPPDNDSLTPAQQAFNQLLARIEAVSGQMARLQAWSDRHRHAHMQVLYEAANQTAHLHKSLLLLLHERVQTADLTAQQQRMARQQVRRLIAALNTSSDAQVLALDEVYREEDEAHEAALDNALAAQHLREKIEAAMGQPLHNPNLYQTPDEVLAAGMRQWQQQHAADEARKAAKRTARKAQRRPTAHPQQVQQQSDAKGAIRTVYRQLASLLHPDREMDPQAQERKTRLMGEVNAAYERNDLTTLLRLQLQVAHVDPQHLARLSNEKLAGMSLLLKEQLAALQDDVWQLQSQLSRELGLALDAQFSEEVWTHGLQRIQADRRYALERLEADLQRIQQASELKRWLKEQALLAKEQAMQATLDGLT
jgi:hypothetical protein